MPINDYIQQIDNSDLSIITKDGVKYSIGYVSDLKYNNPEQVEVVTTADGKSIAAKMNLSQPFTATITVRDVDVSLMNMFESVYGKEQVTLSFIQNNGNVEITCRKAYLTKIPLREEYNEGASNVSYEIGFACSTQNVEREFKGNTANGQ